MPQWLPLTTNNKLQQLSLHLLYHRTSFICSHFLSHRKILFCLFHRLLFQTMLYQYIDVILAQGDNWVFVNFDRYRLGCPSVMSSYEILHCLINIRPFPSTVTRGL